MVQKRYIDTGKEVGYRYVLRSNRVRLEARCKCTVMLKSPTPHVVGGIHGHKPQVGLKCLMPPNFNRTRLDIVTISSYDKRFLFHLFWFVFYAIGFFNLCSYFFNYLPLK